MATSVFSYLKLIIRIIQQILTFARNFYKFYMDSFLKMFKEVIFFSTSGIKFQIIGPKYLIEFDPFSTALICEIAKSDSGSR